VLTFEGECVAAMTAFLGPGVLARVDAPMSSVAEPALSR
jgi:hypothetical protein